MHTRQAMIYSKWEMARATSRAVDVNTVDRNGDCALANGSTKCAHGNTQR